MNKIDLNELPRWSPWVSRLLGITPGSIPSRTIEKIDQEYDKDKYARCLDYFSSFEGITAEKIREFEYEAAGIKPDSKICVSFENELYEMTLKEAIRRYNQIIIETIASEIGECRTIIELGAGYGYNLWLLQQHFPDKNFWGGSTPGTL